MKIVAIGLALMLVLTALAALPPNAARAQTDACGVLGFDAPDSGRTFDFSTACAAHDECYEEFHDSDEVARKACDDQFLADMRKSCADMWSAEPLRQRICNSIAQTYYSAVRVGGWLAFYN